MKFHLEFYLKKHIMIIVIIICFFNFTSPAFHFIKLYENKITCTFAVYDYKFNNKY